MTRSLLLAILVLLACPLKAQVVTFDGQLRHRSEFDDKGLTESGDAYLFHILRSRLGVTARPSEHVSAYVQIQDSRMFGSEDPTLGQGTLDASADRLDFHQAFLGVDVPGVNGLGARVGRQVLSYGNQRIIGEVAWSNVGRTFDGAVLKLNSHRVTADLFAAQLVAPDAMPGSQNLFGLYTSFELNDDHAVDVFGLLDNDTNEITAGADAGDDRALRFTPGFRAYGSASAFDYELEAIYQTGKIAPDVVSARNSISAYLLAANAGYKAGGATFRAGYTRLSGDDDAGDGENQTFNTLFASNHAFYGFMDYFPGLSGASGLQDANLSVTSAVGRGLRVQLDGHHFAAAASTPGVSNTFGQEVDLVLSFNGSALDERAMDGFQLSAGASMFLPGSRLESVLGTDPTWWVYLMSMVSF